jgi:hypothetical protein
MEVCFHTFLSLASEKEVTGQIHAPATLPLKKQIWLPTDYKPWWAKELGCQQNTCELILLIGCNVASHEFF